MYIWVFKEMLKIRDRTPLNIVKRCPVPELYILANFVLHSVNVSSNYLLVLICIGTVNACPILDSPPPPPPGPGSVSRVGTRCSSWADIGGGGATKSAREMFIPSRLHHLIICPRLGMTANLSIFFSLFSSQENSEMKTDCKCISQPKQPGGWQIA